VGAEAEWTGRKTREENGKGVTKWEKKEARGPSNCLQLVATEPTEKIKERGLM
jgi:hypothetical protein